MSTEVGTSPVCPPPSPPCAQMMSTPASSAFDSKYVGGKLVSKLAQECYGFYCLLCVTLHATALLPYPTPLSYPLTLATRLGATTTAD